MGLAEEFDGVATPVDFHVQAGEQFVRIAGREECRCESYVWANLFSMLPHGSIVASVRRDSRHGGLNGKYSRGSFINGLAAGFT